MLYVIRDKKKIKYGRIRLNLLFILKIQQKLKKKTDFKYVVLYNIYELWNEFCTWITYHRPKKYVYYGWSWHDRGANN